MSKSVLVTIVVVLGFVLLLPLLARLKSDGGSDASASTGAAPVQASEPAPAAAAGPAPRADGGPVAMLMNPANGATGVSSSLSQLTVTFSVPMRPGFSWTGGGPNFPETAGKPYWSADMKTCTLPVRLRPNWSYRLGLNSPSHRNFKSSTGMELTPMVWQFSTGG